MLKQHILPPGPPNQAPGAEPEQQPHKSAARSRDAQAKCAAICYVAVLWQQLTAAINLENKVSSTIYPQISVEKILNRTEQDI